MTVSKQEFSTLIRNFNFRELFNIMGWNNDKTEQPIVVDNVTYNLKAVAEKSGFKILLCEAPTGKYIPEYNIRKKIETKLTKLFHEHLIIYIDYKMQEQIWQLAVRQAGKPVKVSETRYNITQQPELLYQRASGLFFELTEEDKITIVDVTSRVNENFNQNSEKVTKQFYDKFKKEHTSFYSFVKGIDDHIDDWNKSHTKNKKENLNKQWYISLMLNRLMFCYFIQKKGFLDNNKNYLRDKLNTCLKKNGKFYSFYRNFLLVLFHQGLNEPVQKENIIVEIGKVPYLNGGLFDVHELEKKFKDIEIENKAFEKIFNFFDEYEWHLDTRPNASGKEVNPDVIGYIFEKYINDRAQMGAYYTKEDITEYISKNCILPYLFEETKRDYPKAYKEDSEIWNLIKESNDEYIYDSVKYGTEFELPENISVGINNVSKRTEWNKPANNKYALPTEIWREVVERRNRYFEIKLKIEKGEILNINDFITYNLNIRQYVQDIIETTKDPELIKHLYNSIKQITILDPTCGSGAFLFAALNVLEPLYEACIQRMENFVIESKKGKFQKFEDILADVKSPSHPNLKYFIYKSIILNNLHGVDIMNEAVEIAKLRLFLKLVATVDADYKKPNLGLEPLPDIDFNIRSGNTLVGFTSLSEAIQAINERDKKGQLGLIYDNEIEVANAVKEEAEKLALAFKNFKNSQLTIKTNNAEIKKAKDFLIGRQKSLITALNVYLAFQYGIQDKKKEEFNLWLESHQPFHWFAEFYEIIEEKKGFDVVIGNPPYLELSQINYIPKNLKSISSCAVHNYCIEKSLQILKQFGNISMIVPLSLVCTQRMTTIQNILESNRTTWYSNYAWRPGKLFDTVNRALTIFISLSHSNRDLFTSKYLKWNSDTRDLLFSNLFYINWNQKRESFWVPKLGNKIENDILQKVIQSDYSISNVRSNISGNRIFYRTTGGLYWKIFTNFPPKFFLNGKLTNSSRETSFAVKDNTVNIICISILSSNLFWWWYTITSNLRDLNPVDIFNFRFPKSAIKDDKLFHLGNKYIKDLEANSIMLSRSQKQTGETKTQSFKVALSKTIIDEIDKVLAKHYKFNDEEIDFVTNYDIKYRMGKELENDIEE